MHLQVAQDPKPCGPRLRLGEENWSFSFNSQFFVHWKLAQSLHLVVTPITEFRVMVANRESLVYQEMYEQVSITIQGFTFSTTLYSLPLKGSDLVLDIQWMELLGPVECDWKKKMTIKFLLKDIAYVIKEFARPKKGNAFKWDE